MNVLCVFGIQSEFLHYLSFRIIKFSPSGDFVHLEWASILRSLLIDQNFSSIEFYYLNERCSSTVTFCNNSFQDFGNIGETGNSFRKVSPESEFFRQNQKNKASFGTVVNLLIWKMKPRNMWSKALA